MFNILLVVCQGKEGETRPALLSIVWLLSLSKRWSDEGHGSPFARDIYKLFSFHACSVKKILATKCGGEARVAIGSHLADFELKGKMAPLQGKEFKTAAKNAAELQEEEEEAISYLLQIQTRVCTFEMHIFPWVIQKN